MNWLLPALIAPILYAIVVFIDKYVVSHKVTDSRGMPLYGAIASVVFGTGLWFVMGMPLIGWSNTLLLLVSGVFAIIGASFYFYALAKSHASYINAALQLMPVFLLIMALTVLNEQLNTLQFAGFAAIFIAVIGLSIERDGQKLRFNKALISVMVACVFFALSALIVKFTSDLNQLGTLIIYEAWGFSFGGLLVFIFYKGARRSFLTSFGTVGKSALGFMFFNEIIFLVSKALTFLAITLGPVALVGVLEGTQVFYALILGVVLTLLFPKFFHESIAKKDIMQKVLLSLLLFAGVWMITY